MRGGMSCWRCAATSESAQRMASPVPRMSVDYATWARGEDHYPSAFLDLENPPNEVYAVGDRAVLDRQTIAVIGARRAGPISLAFARRISRTLAKAGACVVSGLAIGVD